MSCKPSTLSAWRLFTIQSASYGEGEGAEEGSGDQGVVGEAARAVGEQAGEGRGGIEGGSGCGGDEPSLYILRILNG